MKKKVIIAVSAILGIIAIFVLALFIEENDILDELSFNNNKKKVTVKTVKKVKTVEKVNTNSNIKAKSHPTGLFGPKVNISASKAKSIKFQPYDNGLFSMQIPKGWTVGVAKSDFIHYTFMVYDPQNPDYKIFFNMKTEGYLKTQEMKNLYRRYYPSAPFGKLPVISPETTAGFYKVFTPAFNESQSILPFKVPVIKDFNVVQNLGKNITGGSIVRATYKNESGKTAEGVFTATIKEFAMPPVVLLIVYNTIFFTVPEGELVDWLSVLNYCVSTIRFSNEFTNGYYRQEGQVVANAQALQAICNQTSDIITSGWNERQKTYDILSQKRSDATMGYERVRNTETGDIYKATVGFSDHDWNGKFELITDDMYTLPVSGYIEKQ